MTDLLYGIVVALLCAAAAVLIAILGVLWCVALIGWL